MGLPRFILSRLKPYRGQPSPEAVPHPRLTARASEPNYDRSPVFAELRREIAQTYIDQSGHDVKVPREAVNRIENLFIRIADLGLADEIWWVYGGAEQVAGLRQLLSDRIEAADRERQR